MFDCAEDIRGEKPLLKFPIQFQVLDWYIPEADRVGKIITDEDEDAIEEIKKYDIYMFGSTSSSHSIAVKITGFEPYFFVKPPSTWTKSNFGQKLSQLNDALSRKAGDKLREHLISVSGVMRKDFWGFTNGTEFPFVQIKISSLRLFYILRNYFKNSKEFKLYESNIEPYLRFIHQRDIDPCGWIEIKKGTFTDGSMRTEYEIEADYRDVSPFNRNQIAPLIIASFDIECSSSHGDFPCAKKDYHKLVIDLINASRFEQVYITTDTYIKWINAAIFDDTDFTTEYNQTIHRVYPKMKKKSIEKNKERIKHNIIAIAEDVQKYIQKAIHAKSLEDDLDSDDEDRTNSEIKTRAEYKLINLLTTSLPILEGDKVIQIGTTVHKYGSPDIIYRHIAVLGSCDPIEDAVVESYNTEQELLLGWKDELGRINPDILTGYNIFGFDFKYIWDRVVELKINDNFSTGLGKINNRYTENIVEQKLSSSALGDNLLSYIDIDGIVLIDMFKIMHRDHKLDSYKLDSVAELFLGDRKHDITPNEIFAKFHGSSADRAEIAKYCLQDCQLVNRLMDKLKILENNIGMANVCSVPLSYLFMRGQGIKIFSLVSKECRLKKHLIPVVFAPDQDLDQEAVVGYEGAIVLDPKEGIYTDASITVLDYSSLYPSSMISCDLSHDRFVDPNGKYANIPDVTYKTISFDLFEGVGDKKHKIGVQDCTFAQSPKGEKGIIPAILQKLLTQRKNTRKKIEYQTITLADLRKITGLPLGSSQLLDVETNQKIDYDPSLVISREDTYNEFEKAVLDALQAAYKVTANSLYGQIGSRTSQIYWKEIAACTTATGREMIMIAKKFVETEYGAEVIYGDTDSIFCKFPIKGPDGELLYGRDTLPGAIAAGQRAAREIKRILPPPQSLEYEKTMFPFIIFSKKRYAGNLYEDDPNKTPKLKTMGIVLKRRDNAPIVKKIYGGIIDIILNKYDVTMSIEFLKSELAKLVQGNVPMDDLIISKTLRGQYKNPLKIAHKVLADRIGQRDPGNKPMANDRIPYVYINAPNAQLQGDRIEHPDYIRENNIKPDYLFYITNQLKKPISQLYALCVDKIPGSDFDDEYWDKWDKKLQSSAMYTGSQRKIDKRILDLKMQVVEHLLFKEYIVDLGGECKKIPTNSIVPPKSKNSPKQRAAAIEAELPVLTDAASELVLSVDKCGKEYICKAEFSGLHVSVWKCEMTIPHSKTKGETTKEGCFRKIALKAFDHIKNDINVLENGVRIYIVKLPTLVHKWIEQMGKYLLDESEDYDLSDTSKVQEEINNTRLFSHLLDFMDAFNYSINKK